MKTADNRKINLPSIPLDETHRIACYVMFPTCTGLERVYSLHVQPMETRTYSDGHRLEVYEPRRGYRARLEASPRYNRKRLEALAAAPETLALAQQIAERVRAEHTA